jgi:hypothetical protein
MNGSRAIMLPYVESTAHINVPVLRWPDDRRSLARARGLPKSCQMDLGDCSAQLQEAMAAETWARTAKAKQVCGMRARVNSTGSGPNG